MVKTNRFGALAAAAGALVAAALIVLMLVVVNPPTAVAAARLRERAIHPTTWKGGSPKSA